MNALPSGEPSGRWLHEVMSSVPTFRCGSESLTDVYRWRWETFARHVARGRNGWVITEFTQPGPGRAFGTINAAAGHHIMEGRWLGNTTVVEDYLRFWYDDPDSEPHRYSEWMAWAALEFAKLQGTRDAVAAHLPAMVANYDAWRADSQHESGLFWVHDLADAMECTISGDGLRPSINSYQYGNAVAISQLAERAGDHATAARFADEAARLRTLVMEHLWDPEREFFLAVPLGPRDPVHYRAVAGVTRRLPPAERSWPVPRISDVPLQQQVRELIGYLPWYFDLPGDDVDPGPAIRELTDSRGFAAPFGLRTAERRHPRYGFPPEPEESPPFICRWNGPSWPFATSQTLGALERIIRSGGRREYGALFLQLLEQYASAHIREDGSYWIDEQIDPDSGEWIVRNWRLEHEPERADLSRDYLHSAFVDHVLSGLLGLRADDTAIVIDPLPAVESLGWFTLEGLRLRGRDVAARWEPGAGLHLSVDGRVVSAGGLETLRVSLD